VTGPTSNLVRFSRQIIKIYIVKGTSKIDKGMS